MNPALVATVSAALILTGVAVAIAGFFPGPEKTSAPSRTRRSLPISRDLAIRLGVAAGVGLVAGIITGWVVLVVIFPLAVVLIPYLFGSNSKRELERLDALDSWSRSLSGVLGAGVSLEQALVATHGSAPAALRPEIHALIARIRSRISLEDALRRFAADVDDATCDKIVTTLLLVSRRGDGGLVRVLEDLAASVAEEVAARRMVDAERAKQTAVVRYVTLITVGVLGGFLAFGGSYVAPYGTPVGQLVLLVLLGLYVAILVWMRRMAVEKPLPRLLTRKAVS